ncbi:MAG: hypothetical protein FWC74_01250 [Candidatus Bathyarchaeota archaeon]|nr:hypothetical protein [Candidatus Termitimicrobium sp.]
MSAEVEIRRFFETYVQSRGGIITHQTNDTTTVAYPDGSTQDFTYNSNIAKEKNIPLLTSGSPFFQQILQKSIENGTLCQISLNNNDPFDPLIKSYFRDTQETCLNCQKTQTIHGLTICTKTAPCFHQINNGKITSIKISKKEPIRLFQFYYSVNFQNKLRTKNEETFIILLNEENDCTNNVFNLADVLENTLIHVEDFKSKIKPEIYDKLKAIADQKLNTLLRVKTALFDLPLCKEKQMRLRSFERRLRRERRERVISKKHDFDFQKWQSGYETLLQREEESYQTNITVKLQNLLVINTSKVKFEVTLDNKATIQSTVIIGIDNPEAICPLCRKTHTEGYATEDGLYVCEDCIRQSVESGKIYSKKAPLTRDETLGEYFERDKGFVCSVCGKRHSCLIEFKCSHDNTSVCIYHYDVCDVCNMTFSKLNLTYTDEFRRKLCPKHAKRSRNESEKL